MINYTYFNLYYHYHHHHRYFYLYHHFISITKPNSFLYSVDSISNNLGSPHDDKIVVDNNTHTINDDKIIVDNYHHHNNNVTPNTAVVDDNQHLQLPIKTVRSGNEKSLFNLEQHVIYEVPMINTGDLRYLHDVF
jgi:hypothetical protein